MNAVTANVRVKPLNVIFCDDVRREISGKDILIGAYGGEIVIPSVPAMISLAMWIQMDTTDAGTARIKIRVTDPQGNVAGQTSLEFQTGEPSTTSSTAIILPPFAIFLPPLIMSVTEPGTIKVYFANDGDKFALIGEKKVRIGQISTAFSPPSGQSPPVPPPQFPRPS
jgi:Family of unknown function (DUF6941)